MGNEMMRPPICQALSKVSDNKIDWLAFSTTNCSYCSSPSNYESAQAALCSNHAEEYLAGKITITKPTVTLSVVAPPQQPPQVSDSNNTKLCILSESGSVGYLEMTPNMTIGEFAEMMKKMDQAEKEVQADSKKVKTDQKESKIELVD
jgi:hypothetical protein